MAFNPPRPALEVPGPAAETAARMRRLGILVMLAAMLAFAMNDVMGKFLVASYSVGQVIFLRSAAALVLLLPILARTGLTPLLKPERPGIQALRVVCSTVEILAFYTAVAYLPLADVMTYWLATPIYVAAASPLLLGEKVGWRRWTAIGIGFCGVVVALEPSAESLSWPALISLVGSLAFAMTIVLGRTLRDTPDTVLVFWHIFGSFLAGLAIVPFAWKTPSLVDLGMLSLLGIVAMSAHIGVNRSLKLAPAADVAPIQYTLLLWALLFGWLVFGDVPRPALLVGAVIIMASGLFIVLREKALGRESVMIDKT